MNVELSLVIPVHRDAAQLERTLALAVPFLAESLGTAFEIIPVIDGVEDESDLVALRWEAACPQVRPQVRPHRGKGAAVAAGILAARGEYVIHTDVDLPVPLDEIPRALAVLAAADVVIGTPLNRRMHGLVFRSLTGLLTGLPYRETQVGFKGYRRDAARTLFWGLTASGPAFDVEVLLRARESGFRAVELPVACRRVSDGSVLELLRLVRRRYRLRAHRLAIALGRRG